MPVGIGGGIRYFADKSTLLRRSDIGGTAFGSCNVNRDWGVLTSSRGIPSASRIPWAVTAKGRRSGPTTSRASPAENSGEIRRKTMAFFNSAITVLQTLVIALGAGLGIWGAINLLEGYGNDNPGAKSQGMKQLMAGGGVALIGTTLVPLLSGLFG